MGDAHPTAAGCRDGTVILELKDGRQISRTCRAPRGSNAGGLEWADVEAKYRRLVPRCGLASDAVEASLACLRSFDTAGGASTLTQRLVLPSTGKIGRH